MIAKMIMVSRWGRELLLSSYIAPKFLSVLTLYFAAQRAYALHQFEVEQALRVQFCMPKSAATGRFNHKYITRID